MDRGAVNDWLILAKLDLLDNCACSDVVPEERAKIRVGCSECVAVPTDAVAAIAGGWPERLHYPILRV